MKTIKMFQIALAITILSIITGCSDQLIAPEQNFTDSKPNEFVIPTVSEAAVNRFTVKIRLRGHRSYTFNSSNTGFVKLHSINAEVVSRNIEIPIEETGISTKNTEIKKIKTECQDLSVYSLASISDIAYSCKSGGFNLKEITIENTGSETIDVYVILTGSKKVEVPVIE